MQGKRSRSGLLPNGLVILYEDRDILVVDKPAGLLTIGTERDKSRTAYFILTDYVRKGCARSRNRVFVVHRLDRETSGVLVFAKSQEAKLRLQGEWSETENLLAARVVDSPVARTLAIRRNRAVSTCSQLPKSIRPAATSAGAACRSSTNTSSHASSSWS